MVSKALIDSYSNLYKFNSVNHVLIEYHEIQEEIKNLCGILYINIIDINRETYKKNGIEAIGDIDGILFYRRRIRRRIRTRIY